MTIMTSEEGDDMQPSNSLASSSPPPLPPSIDDLMENEDYDQKWITKHWK